MNPPSASKREISSTTTSRKKIKLSVPQNEIDPPKNERKYYNKTHATGGYCGNEYEIKLSGLIWLNLKYDDDVKDFLLGTNVVAARPLDDICVKIVWKDEKRKPTVIVIQLKHKINEKNTAIELDEIFSAYKKIKKNMNEEEDDGLFEGKFDELECYSILYTNENFTLKTDVVTDHNYWPKLNDIIGTHGSIRKLSEEGKEKYIKNMREKNEDCSENEFNAFVNSLLVFSRQASEMGVEEILKEHIDQHPRAFKNPFPLEPHPVTLTYIRTFVDWWKEVKQPYYFTKQDELLENAFKAIIKSPWMSSLNIIYKSKINSSYKFTDDAVSSLNLQDQHSSTVITTENSVLTVVKVLQHLDNIDHVVLDLEYIASLQHGNRKALCEELKTKEDYVVILVCDKIPKNETFNDIGEVTKNKIRILISNNNKSSQKLTESFLVGEGEEHKEVHDEKNRLTDMSEESQLNIFETGTVIFRDKEVNLSDIMNDESKKYVKGDILQKIFNRKTITVGKLIVESKYDEIKQFWVDRRVGRTFVKLEFYLDRQVLNTLNDIKDDVVLLIANPGMGKSTLLTHLSIRTRECNPEIWIFRINLLEYTNAFIDWKHDETDIDLLETLKFMCQVILRNALGKANQGDLFTLDTKDNVVYLKQCTADPQIEFELNLFLHFYYERDIIFLFDGFDEICTDYSDVVIKCLKTISNGLRKHKMWVTSRPYNEVKTKLEKEFALENLSYEIENFTRKEMEEYLQLFWKFNLKVEELNEAQLDNVRKLLEHVLSVCDERVPEPITGSLYGVIKNAALYLSYKIKHTDIPLWKYNKNYHHNIFLKSPYNFKDDCDCCACCFCIGSCTKCNNIDFRFPVKRVECDANPLFLYLAAVDVVYNIKKIHKNTEEWYLNVNHYTVYKHFLEKKIEIQFQEKNGNEISKPKNKTAYKKEVVGSILKHKKLAAYGIFRSYNHIMFTDKDLEEIKEMIEDVEKGEETNGLLESVANGVPIFTHKTFAEFFAVEYICDCLKIENICEKSLFLCFTAMFLNELDYEPNVRKIFDHRLKIDKSLKSALENNKDMIFKWLKRNIGLLTFMTVKDDLHNVEEFFDEVIDYGLKNTSVTNSEKQMFETQKVDRVRGRDLYNNQVMFDSMIRWSNARWRD